MYSYNNIIDKTEPANKHVIDAVVLRNNVPIGEVLQRHLDERVDVVVVENFLSGEECDEIIDACEQVGFTYWQQKDSNATDNFTECEDKDKKDAHCFRVVDTIEATFPRLSAALSTRISNLVRLEPKTFNSLRADDSEMFARDLEGTWLPLQLCSNLLLGRYGPGGHFSPHIDGSTIVDINTRSLYTLLVYLNDCEIGGETVMFAGDQADVLECDVNTGKCVGKEKNRICSFRPKKGSAAFFFCDVLHEGSPVGEGCSKYILRGDFLYRREPQILTGENDAKAFALYEEARVAESNGDAFLACKLFQRVRKLSPGVAELYQL